MLTRNGVASLASPSTRTTTMQWHGQGLIKSSSRQVKEMDSTYQIWIDLTSKNWEAHYQAYVFTGKIGGVHQDLQQSQLRQNFPAVASGLAIKVHLRIVMQPQTQMLKMTKSNAMPIDRHVHFTLETWSASGSGDRGGLHGNFFGQCFFLGARQKAKPLSKATSQSKALKIWERSSSSPDVDSS